MTDKQHDDHVCDGGWACHFADVRKVKAEKRPRCGATDRFDEGCVLPDGHEGEHLFPLETEEMVASLSEVYLTISEKDTDGLHIMITRKNAAKLRHWLNCIGADL